jgi:hypothetical protein
MHSAAVSLSSSSDDLHRSCVECACRVMTAVSACYFDRRLAMQELPRPATTMTRRMFSPW